MILIPFDPNQSGDQVIRIKLGDQAVTLRLIWNVRDEAWTMNVVGDFGTLKTLKLVPDWPLLRYKEAHATFLGDFIVRALTREVSGQDIIRFEDLGVKWGLLWMSPDEKLSWEAFYGLG